MNANDILDAIAAGECSDWEFKSAKNGMPSSLWATYSAMANTDGGVIVLGVKEHDGDFEVQGLDDAAKTEKDFWTTINNRGKVSANLLASPHGDKSRRPRFGAHAQGATSRALAKSPHQRTRTSAIGEKSFAGVRP